jgi:hypothetical protein
VVFITLSAALFAMGMAYGPLSGWLSGLFPVEVRYSGISMAFNAGGIIGGALTPVLAQSLIEKGMGNWIDYSRRCGRGDADRDRLDAAVGDAAGDGRLMVLSSGEQRAGPFAIPLMGRCLVGDVGGG